MTASILDAPIVKVPGKMFLAGEYAVLEGAPAIVAAVGRYATASFVPHTIPASAIVAAAMKEARARMALVGTELPPGSAQVDTSRLVHQGIKLGLGSSAACAVATAAAALEFGGFPIAENRALLLDVADTAHRAAQGGVGSGADIAAAVQGGFLRFARRPDGSVTIQPIAPAPGLELVAFWTHAAARTVDFVTQVQRFARESRSVYGQHRAALHGAATRFAAAFPTSPQDAIAEAAAYGDALAALGTDTNLPIVMPVVQETMALAQALGGAAKPSGAGGGDMGIALFAGKDAAAAFTARCPPGVLVLDIPFGVGGTSRIAPDDVKTFKKD